LPTAAVGDTDLIFQETPRSNLIIYRHGNGLWYKNSGFAFGFTTTSINLENAEKADINNPSLTTSLSWNLDIPGRGGFRLGNILNL
jgi:hypothetical protein